MSEPILIDGEWRLSKGKSFFQAQNPKTRESLPEQYPVSPWEEIEEIIQASARAFQELRGVSGDRFAAFFDGYATRLEARKSEIVERASLETALPVEPRLSSAEFPRTVNQLRQAAQAARTDSWRMLTIDTKLNIRSQYESLGPVCVFGPNNFPLAFNGASGGDFAAAVAAGNPVIVKGHPGHPGTTRILTEEAFRAAQEAGLPKSFIQMIYRTSHEDGGKLVGHHLIGATGYTGGRSAGLTLKQSADRLCKPIYLELSSINPVCILPGALAERGSEIAEEFTGSCLMGAGQFCTNPGLVLLLESPATDQWIQQVQEKFQKAAVGTLLAETVLSSLQKGVKALESIGAKPITGGRAGGGVGISHENTLLQMTGEQFLRAPAEAQTEMFGNCSVLVISKNLSELVSVLEHLEGNLTGAIYSAKGGSDNGHVTQIEPILRSKVGRIMNDKMPTGVAVSLAMNHGGPYPSTGHPGFTAVGIPASIRRFAKLTCFDNIREERLPRSLRNANPYKIWRCVDGAYSQESITT